MHPASGELRQDLDNRVDLPPVNTLRWSPQRKALVVEAVHNGAISFADACNRYQVSAEELLAWQHAMETHGLGGLRVTRLQAYSRRAVIRERSVRRAESDPKNLT
jgi:transposase-like protein